MPADALILWGRCRTLAARANVWSDDSCTKGQYRPGRSAVMVRCLTGAAPTARTHDAWSLRDGSPGHSPSPRRWPGLFLLLRTQPFRYQLHPAACRLPSWSSLKSLRENHRFAASTEGVGLPTAFHHRGRGRGRAPGAMERAASPVRASRFPPRC